MRLSVGVTIRSAFAWRKAGGWPWQGGARIILQRFGPPAFSPLCHCRICGMARPHSSSIRRVVGGIRAGQKIGSSNQPDFAFVAPQGYGVPKHADENLVRQLCGRWLRLPRRRDLQARTPCKSLRAKSITYVLGINRNPCVRNRPVCTENLNSNVVVMKAAEDRV